MTPTKAFAILREEYDVIQWTGDKFTCYIEYSDEWHTVTVQGAQLWGYCERTNHRWLIN